ncbi:hypothetical protein L6164_022921 [Bauhinia variegata]|uniref:Uncharacterized protein n=1 Tax=Bauhinia variegata TaxID=167791 RepID=A0ACB9MHZ1_BAUVA|nr:hypothetical protein L6164_022921 [Bauhinia variegata]
MLDFNAVFGAVVPMYVAIILGYAAVKWWNILTPEQCSGISGYVADFAVPFLILDLITGNNIYNMNYRVIIADFLQKAIILAGLLIWKFLSKKGSLEWVISIFSLATQANTLLIGIPILQSMYGDATNDLLIQIVVIQGIIWCNFLLALYEYRAAKLLIAEQFPSNAGSIATVTLESDVHSLSFPESLETDTTLIENNRRLHVVIRCSSTRSQPPRPSVDSFWSLDSPRYREISAKSRDSFSLQPSERAGATAAENASYTAVSEMKHHRFECKNNLSKVSHESHDGIDMFEASEGSFLKHQTSPKSGSYKDSDQVDVEKQQAMPSSFVVAKLITVTVWRKLIRNSTTYASVVAMIWSLIAYRFDIKMPLVVQGSIKLLSKTGTGIAMFSLGLFTALQPKILSCSIGEIIMFTIMRFIIGPVVMGATSFAAGLRGVLFQGATIQSALPSALVCFVFAKQYNVYPGVFSSSIILTTVAALPATIVYYYILLKV